MLIRLIITIVLVIVAIIIILICIGMFTGKSYKVHLPIFSGIWNKDNASRHDENSEENENEDESDIVKKETENDAKKKK